MFFIIWHGFGWLTVIFVGGFYCLFQAVLPERSENVVAALSYICSSVPCWFVGRWLRNNYTNIIKDKKSGQSVRVRQPYHALFFIPMHFWAPISLALGLFLLVYPSSPASGTRVSSVVNSASPATGSWRTFTSPTTDFCVSAPSDLTAKLDEIQSPSGTIQQHTYSTTLNEIYFAVVRGDYPEGVLSSRTTSEVLDGGRDGEVNAVDGRLLGESVVSLDNMLGREATIEARTKDGKMIYITRMCVVGDHLYLMMVGAAPQSSNDPAIKHFLDSFRFTTASFKPNTRQASIPDNSTSSANPIATGTGFFITDDGYLISNYHVVKDATKVRLLTGAGLIDAKVVQVDAANDLALLKADGRFAPLPIAASRTVNLGGTVATVGFPDIGLQGFAPKLAKGEIASLSGAADDPRYFQISVPVQPGNSGGALVDERGNVIGIVSAKLNASAALAASGALPENVNYAVKSSLLLSFLESVPSVSAKLKAPVTADRKFEDVVKSAQDAAVLVLVY